MKPSATGGLQDSTLERLLFILVINKLVNQVAKTMIAKTAAIP